MHASLEAWQITPGYRISATQNCNALQCDEFATGPAIASGVPESAGVERKWRIPGRRWHVPAAPHN